MMNKEKKKNYIEEMKNILSKTNSLYVAHYQGLTVKQIEELKNEVESLKEDKVELRSIRGH